MTTHDTHAGLTAAIVEAPHDVGLRLVFADFLEERAGPGDVERSEFIRVQCRRAEMDPYHLSCGGNKCGTPECNTLRRRERELWAAYGGDWFADLIASGFIVSTVPNDMDAKLAIVRNGAVEVVRCPLEAWVGAGKCQWCAGTGKVYKGILIDCPDCSGTGTAPGLGARLVTCQPVLEIRTEKRPLKTEGVELYTWSCPGNRPPNGFWELPREVFDLLLPDVRCVEVRDSLHGFGASTRRYHSEADALGGLSRGALLLARRRAGLGGEGG